MILLPAVDIRDGKAVRLRQGRFDEETVYADDPLEAARSFVEAGARYLHVVDLDGAREGEPANLDHLRADHARRRACRCSTAAACARCCRSARRCRPGAERVVVGTAAYSDADFLEEALATWGLRVLVAVDVRGGKRVGLGLDARDADAPRGADRAPAAPGRAPLRLHERRPATGCSRAWTWTRSGGSPRRCAGASSGPAAIGSLDDLRALRDLRLLNLAGVISGKALYEGRFDGGRGAGRARGARRG